MVMLYMVALPVHTVHTYHAGDIAVLVKALQTDKHRAHTAFDVLWCLTSASYMSEKQIRNTHAQIARLCGVHHLCRLLCPALPPGDLAPMGKALTPDLPHAHVSLYGLVRLLMMALNLVLKCGWLGCCCASLTGHMVKQRS